MKGMDDTTPIKKNIWVIIAVIVIAALVVFYVARHGQKPSTLPAPPESLQVPQVTIQNNPIEKKVPEINPVERANPFKYKNPLSK